MTLSRPLTMLLTWADRLSVAEHVPSCPSLTAKEPFWQEWTDEVDADGKVTGLRWRGPKPKWKRPTCDGCNPTRDRNLWASIAQQVRNYEQHPEQEESLW